MSKRIESPVKRWPGYVVLSDPLTFPMVYAFEDALNAVQIAKDDLTTTRADQLILPGMLACVEEFELEGFPTHPTAETFPATPRIPSNRLIAWLVSEISKLYQEASTIPNA